MNTKQKRKNCLATIVFLALVLNIFAICPARTYIPPPNPTLLALGVTVQSNTASVTVDSALIVSISPTSVVINVGQSVTFNSTVSGGTPPYTYQWYLDDSPVPGATNPTWTFTPASPGTYEVYLKVTDQVGETAKSNIASVLSLIHISEPTRPY